MCSVHNFINGLSPLQAHPFSSSAHGRVGSAPFKILVWKLSSSGVKVYEKIKEELFGGRKR